MMFFRAVALLFAFAALLSECQSAHSDRSRQRTGPIRSVPVAADIKRDADFNCPEEFGYYPHPTDCTQYYVCVFGGALLESCTGGLMYSHELQTCDWPRNVGCDAIGAIDSDEIERVIEKKPLPPAPAPLPRRVPSAFPPPPQRVQPNPVVTSRGQPKFTREEYEKQQQLYAEVDDLPPVEEIESDRQQRVYRGQPSTIGQVQRDRDGYAQVNSGRTLNSNIIPASIAHNSGKIGSFSFGTQVDDRRSTATQAPRSFSEDTSDLTDSLHDRQSDIETNVVDKSTVEKGSYRKKREAVDEPINKIPTENNSTLGTDDISKRNDGDLEEYVETETEFNSGEIDESNEDGERGKRQVRHGRYYFKDGYKTSGKNWGSPKPEKYVNIPQLSYTPPNSQNIRYQSNFNSLNTNNFLDGARKPFFDENQFSTSNPFLSYLTEHQPDKPFKPSLPDFSSQKQAYNPVNSATQIITKSPPISALTNNENPFAALAGGFYNNNPRPTNNQNYNQPPSHIFSSNKPPSNQNSFHDSSHVPSSVVTGKPVLIQTPRTQNKYRQNSDQPKTNIEIQNSRDANTYYKHKPNPTLNKDYQDENKGSREEEINSSEENSSEDDEDVNHSTHLRFPDPPYEFTHPSNKYADIKNPFADPNFDFDDFISKLRDGPQKSEVTTSKPKYNSPGFRPVKPSSEVNTTLPTKTGFRSSSLNYHGMSTPRPFSMPTGEPISQLNQDSNFQTTAKQPVQFEKTSQRPNQQQIPENHRQQENYKQNHQQSSFDDNIYNRPVQINAGTPYDAIRPKLKPPNFQDDRQLPINYNFQQAIQNNMRSTTERIQFQNENNKNQVYSVTQKPNTVISATGSPIYFTSPKQQYFSTGKPYLISNLKPNFFAIKKSTPRPMTTANEHLSALQQFWNNKQAEFEQKPTRPTPVSDMPNLESLFSQAVKSSTQSHFSGEKPNIVQSYSPKPPSTTTTKAPFPRRPIPKPSPEMSDYYYDDDDEQYYYEPPIKSQYMPSSEVRPRRPPMAQNYQEYEDSESYEDESPEVGPQRPSVKRPDNYNTYKTDSETKNHNGVSIVTKPPNANREVIKNNVKNLVILNPVSSTQNIRPEITNYKVLHYPNRNKTMHIKRPESGPHTAAPPKYLNQTTLRPYTVRHRLAKPTTVQTHMTQTTQAQDMKTTKGRTRHPNIVTQTRATTPRDSHNQETRYTKTQHDDRTNSLEPTESISPTPFQPSPRPKMLYNGSQSYNPEQYDPYYAVYDEDGELYKDTDYVQQYNLASLRPAVQQTYRGTPPPARRPVETFTARPVLPDDYDDALIQGQINNDKNQYQTPIRHSTRGEGNELGFDNNPNHVKTTVFEATSISTTPSTTSSTSTTTTTQRPTVAPFTEAMTPSRYVTRSSTENPVQNPESSISNQPLSNNAFPSSIPSTSLPAVNFSTLAKPFEKTDNLYRLKETLTSTERPSRLFLHKSNNNEVETVKTNSNTDDKQVVSLTSGFSIRRNFNNTENPYTLTVLTRPFENNYEQSRERSKNQNKSNKQEDLKRYYYDNVNFSNVSEKQYIENENIESGENTSSDRSMRRTDSSSEIISEERDIPIYVRPTAKLRVVEPKIKTSTSPTTTGATKFFLKTVIKRPVPFSLTNEKSLGSTENSIDTESLIERALLNSRDEHSNTSLNEPPSQWDQYDQSKEFWNEPAVGPYETLNNLRNSYTAKDDYIFDTTTTTSAPRYKTYKPIDSQNQQNIDRSSAPSSKPTYYAYRILDEQVKPDHTTEIFNTKAKNILRAFINNFVSTPKPRHIHIISSTPRPIQEPEKVVNIGFHKKLLKYTNELPLRTNAPRLQIITEPIESGYVTPTINSLRFIQPERGTDITSTTTPAPITDAKYETTPSMTESTTNSQYYEIPSSEINYSRFSTFIKNDHPENLNSQKFHKIVNEKHSTESVVHVNDNVSYNNEDNELTKLTKTNYETKDFNDFESERQINQFTSTTTRTTKGTTTVKNIEPTTSTKSLSFPTRASRVNPAIKLAAANPAGGRRSYQSSTKCSSDNNLQENPKCNEIKYQRPSSVPSRGRGSAHYSTSGVDAPQQPQQIPNRGTPPTRSRPTLKPSTSIVSKNTEFVDIYSYPPTRPSAVYPQPTPDKTAAKCRKDVCLLPDCSCGGKEIPGDLPVENVPQIVLLTFDDSVNDLNKVLYQDLFEKGRVNPNGCPISATFYVSHEWTDYSQVQNLYAAGHEMASHTISHSFGEQFSQKKWNREVGGQREILAAYGGVKLEDVRGMRAPFLSVGGNKMFKMLYDSNFTYDSSMPVYENRPPSWPYTLDYKLFHDCMIPPCPTKSYPGVWEVPMVMWQDLNGGRCSMGDACANPPEAEGVYKMLLKNFDRHYTTNRAPFGLFYHAAWFTQPHHKEGFIMFLDFINRMNDVWIVTNWQALQWVRDPTPINRLNNFQPFQCDYPDRPKKCNNPKVCNLWHKSGVRYMRTCQPCPEIYPWTGKSGIRSSRIDNDIEE